MLESDQPISQLFTLRVWEERLSEDVSELRFQTKHVLSGESRVFRESDQLLHYLSNTLKESNHKSD
jgi:hypothetical protein